MPNQIVTRIATIDDASTLARLNAAFNGVHEAPELLAGRLLAVQHLEIAILAEVAGQIAGFACLRRVPCLTYPRPYSEVTELYVEEAFRRRGVGRALLTHAEQLARTAGSTQLLLLTDVNNTAAQAFYHAVGYEDDSFALRRRLVDRA